VATVAAELNYNAEKSNTLACNLFRQKPFLSKVYEAIESDNDAALQDVVEELDGIRNKLFQTSNYHAFVAANLKVIPKLLDTLVVSLTRSDKAKIDSVGRAIDNVSASSVLRARGDGLPGGDGAVCALSAIESGFLNITAPGIKAYDENHASLLVAIEYLTALEGVFWVKLRGAGLTYSYSISESTDSQLLRFSLFKCTDIVAAFETASNIIAEYAKGNVAVSAIGLENAKSTLAYQIISGRCSKL
jgi:Zn-dependent M16 (insulinase) family peptidase